jgi:hypothetical protein
MQTFNKNVLPRDCLIADSLETFLSAIRYFMYVLMGKTSGGSKRVNSNSVLVFC